MQGVYVLQDVYGAPLGYEFTLYSYGPHSYIALSDLDLAEVMEYVRRELVDVSRGYHDYVYRCERYPRRELTADLSAHIADAAALVAGRSGPELELLGTVLFCDRAALRSGRVATRDQLIEQVHAVRPFQTVETIAAEVDSLLAKGLLAAIATQ